MLYQPSVENLTTCRSACVVQYVQCFVLIQAALFGGEKILNLDSKDSRMTESKLLNSSLKVTCFKLRLLIILRGVSLDANLQHFALFIEGLLRWLICSKCTLLFPFILSKILLVVVLKRPIILCFFSLLVWLTKSIPNIVNLFILTRFSEGGLEYTNEQ